MSTPRAPSSNRVLIWVTLLVAAGLASAHCARGSGHVLTQAERDAILAADGPYDDDSCYYVQQWSCSALNSTGGVTACGTATYPTCSGDCTNSCSGTLNSWACWAEDDGPYGGCPAFAAVLPQQTCGAKMTGTWCTGTPSYCYCNGGTPTQTQCGNLNGEPINAPPECED